MFITGINKEIYKRRYDNQIIENKLYKLEVEEERRLYDFYLSYINKYKEKLQNIHIKKKKLNLKDYIRVEATKELINKYIDQYDILDNIRIREGYKSYIYFDKDHIVACVLIHITPILEDKMIEYIGIDPKYQNHGLSYQILDDIVNSFNSKYAVICKTNALAYNIYTKFGFVAYSESNYMYYMILSDKEE